MDASIFDPKAVYQIGYGLYVLTTKDGEKDNGCIVNTVMQVASTPPVIAVGVNKQNYTCEVIQKTGKLNINTLTESTPFEIFKHFGFQSGRGINKFSGCTSERSENGLIVLSKHSKGFLSLVVEQTLYLGSHILFLCKPVEGRFLSDEEPVTYFYYQKYIKPRRQPEKKKGFVCRICGYTYEGEALPEGFVCPLCKHGASDFEPIS